jgi:hypothetical protein
MLDLAIWEVYKNILFKKKKKTEEEEWEKHGHLPRLSTANEKVSDYKIWKMSSSFTDLCTNDGGYTARASNFKKVPKI